MPWLWHVVWVGIMGLSHLSVCGCLLRMLQRTCACLLFLHLSSSADVLKRLFSVVCELGCCSGLCPVSAHVAMGQETPTALFGYDKTSVRGDGWMLGAISLMRSPLDRVSSGCALAQLGVLCPQMCTGFYWKLCAAPSHHAGESTSANAFRAKYPRSNSVWLLTVPCGHGFIWMTSLLQKQTVNFLTVITYGLKFQRYEPLETSFSGFESLLCVTTAVVSQLSCIKA